MDVLSDAISAVRVGQPSSDRLRVAGTWCARLAAYEGAGFHVVLQGSCWLLPDDDGAPVTLGPGDVVLLSHGTGHVLASEPMGRQAIERAVDFEEWRSRQAVRSVPDGPGVTELLCGKYRLDRSHPHPLMAELPTVVQLPNRIGRHPELRSAIDLLGREVGRDAPGAGVAVPGLLDLLLVYLVRAWLTDGPADGSAAGPADGGWSAALADPVVAGALRALHEAPEQAWSNELLAARAGVSRATLARRFTALVGRSPMAYLAWWRMTSAAALLRDTQAPIDTIARQVGYGSPYALSHAFNRAFGTTPGRYRAARSTG
ncbi:AraC family transcriptional regulator [Kitasatospora sp. NBC_01266]|uniref:AraC family transcriptional regulator n=1 Tax=Kitasatospora sp. NBC_01266 TaxID=2903572 RepID=UPI002E316E63|nr:AraC family transcriptional regulator [Kitasatospora sp. NBC_01266]